MIPASEILGLDVASTGVFFLVLLGIHVIAALTAIVSGLRAMLLSKTDSRHPVAGRVYGLALVAVFLTACAMSAFRWPDDVPLVALGAGAVAAAAYGYMYRRRRRPGHVPHIVAMGASYVLMLTAFYVDNGPHLPVWSLLPPWSFWFLPAVVGAPLIVRASMRHGRRRSGRRASRGRSAR